MVAWISAWTTLAPTPAAKKTSAPDPPIPAPAPAVSTTTRGLTSQPPTALSSLSSLPCAGQLVAVLTQMALAHA
jgi:hypothetical protein